jgi:hypothetical protein
MPKLKRTTMRTTRPSIKDGTANGATSNAYLTSSNVSFKTKCIIMKYRTGTLYNQNVFVFSRVGGFSRQTSFLFLTYGGEIVSFFPFISARRLTTTRVDFPFLFLYNQKHAVLFKLSNLPPLPTSRQCPAHPFLVPAHANKEHDHQKTQLSMPPVRA